jgi:hypothetical protein
VDIEVTAHFTQRRRRFPDESSVRPEFSLTGRWHFAVDFQREMDFQTALGPRNLKAAVTTYVS